MAKDFDFRRTPTIRAPQPIAQPTVAPVIPQKPKKDKNTKKASWLVAIVIFGVFGVLFGLYYQSLTTTTTNSNNLGESSVTTDAEKKQLVVDVFDGSAGAETVSNTIATLKNAGFTVKDAGKTQFEYDKTYIWYVTGFQEDAEKIASLLNPRQTVLKESKVSGSFTIQIQLGKE